MASKRAKNALLAGATAVSVAIISLIKPWEGRSLVAYRDIVGVATICDGETKGVKMGMRKTSAQCDEMLLRRVENDFYKPLTKCIKGYTRAPKSVQAAMLSLSYNVGVGAGCKSTAARHIASGRFVNACHAMTAFNKAGGRVVQGLKNRREMGDKTRIGELELCLEGL